MIKDFLSSDKLGSTVFAPVKMDFVGNIKVRVGFGVNQLRAT